MHMKKEKKTDRGRDRPREKIVNVTKEDLCELQKVLDSRKGCLSSTYKKNSEAKNKVYDFNQRVVAALNRLAVDSAYREFWQPPCSA